jgi:hypothetical protein
VLEAADAPVKQENWHFAGFLTFQPHRATLLSDGATLLGQGEALLDDGEGLVGQGEALLGDGEGLVGEGEALLGHGEGLFPRAKTLVGRPKSQFGRAETRLPVGEAHAAKPEIRNEDWIQAIAGARLSQAQQVAMQQDDDWGKAGSRGRSPHHNCNPTHADKCVTRPPAAATLRALNLSI